MPTSITLPVGYQTTIEKCPVCLGDGMIVKHGYDATGPLHLEKCVWADCSEYGEHIIIVGFDCPVCAAQHSD